MNFSPILYRRHLSRYYEFQVIGGVQDGNWLAADAVTDKIQFEQTFDLYALTGFAGRAVTKDYGVPLFNPRCGEMYIGSDFSTDIPNLIGLIQGWDVTYRPWQEIPVDMPVYRQAVADWLGISPPEVRVTRILRVDIDGDDVDEVFISAAHFEDESGHMTEQGDYSIILMRKVDGNEVLTVPVVADVYTSQSAELTFPFTYSLAGLLDLNRDGNLELIVEVARWEGGGVAIYQVDGMNVVQALSSFCSG